jgi:hypothetical protein
MTRHNTGFVLDEKRWFSDQRILHLNRHDDETKKNILSISRNDINYHTLREKLQTNIKI